MTHTRMLTVTSVLAALFFSLHWADEIARGIDSGTFSSYGGILILFVWMYAALALIDRRLGLVVLLLASLLASGVPIMHMRGVGFVGGRIPPNSSGAFFWVWTNIALGVSGMISLALAARALWNLRRKVLG
jgi:hypothetical protein